MPNNKFSLAWDPAIAQAFLVIDRDVDLWSIYDRVRCPVLLLHGLLSDILPTLTFIHLQRFALSAARVLEMETISSRLPLGTESAY